MLTFTQRSTKMRVTDPCYEKCSRSSGVLKNVLPGTWIAEVELSEGIISRLRVYHEDYSLRTNQARSPTSIRVCVDSGQAGFFDESEYPEGSTGDFNDLNSMYGQICKATLSDAEHGTIEYGVASRSGYGDGVYECYAGRNLQEQIISAEIDFMSDVYDDEYSDGDGY